MTQKPLHLMTILTLASTPMGCGDDGSDGGSDGAGSDGAGSDGGSDGAGSDGAGSDGAGTDGTAGSTLRWELTGLAPLGEGFVYEGWIIVDGMPVSTGRFTVDGTGVPSADSFDVTAQMAEMATKFVLSIEPEPDADPGPAATKLLAGDFAGQMATVSVADPAALGTDFSAAAGPYILNTPSSADEEDWSRGIWWLDPMAGPGATLELPSLPDGWVYEGWVAGVDGPVTTGRFTAVDEADMDGAGPTSGPETAPPFPGQDFIDPPLDLIGMAAVISVEPEPDDSAAPFVLKPLLDPTIEDLGAGVIQDMDNNASETNPSGTAWFE